MKFDTFLETVGDWGRFQKVKYAIICLTYMLPPIMVYTYTFTAAKPEFRCENPELNSSDYFNETLNELFKSKYKPTQAQCNSLGLTISTEECQRCYLQPISAVDQNEDQSNRKIEQCTRYVFNKALYQTTLVEEWNMVCDRVVYPDKYGRRPVMSVSFILMSFSGLLCAFGPQRALGFWPSYLIFALSRFLIACATRGISVSGFVLGSEIVGPDKRLLTGIVIEYFFAFGQVLLLIFAYFIRTWRELIFAVSLFTIPYILFYFILPESPRWLVSKARFDDAEKVLRYIATKNKRNFNQDAFQQMKAEQERNTSLQKHQGGIQSLFRSKIMCIISMNLFFQWLVQNLVFYGVSQDTASWKLNPYVSFAISAFVELLGYILVHLILDRLGRKKPYFTFSIGFGVVALLILPVQIYMTKGSTAQLVIISMINITLKFLASASYATIYIYANELFPTNVRNTGMGICSMVARIGAIIGTFCNDYLVRIWIYLPIFLYGIVSLVAAILSLMFPETLNKPLPQTVTDVEKMGFIGLPGRKPKITTMQIQSTLEINEETTMKTNPQSCDTNDSKL